MEFCGFFWNIIQWKSKKGQKRGNCLIFVQLVIGSYLKRRHFGNFLYGNDGQKMCFGKNAESATSGRKRMKKVLVSNANQQKYGNAQWATPMVKNGREQTEETEGKGWKILAKNRGGSGERKKENRPIKRWVCCGILGQIQVLQRRLRRGRWPCSLSQSRDLRMK